MTIQPESAHESSPSPLPFLAPFLGLTIWSLLAPLRPTGAFDTEIDRQLYGVSLAWYWGGEVLLLSALTLWGSRVVLRQFPWRLSFLSVIVGVFGCGLWILLCSLQWESQLINSWGLQSWLPPRSGLNPASFGNGAILIQLWLYRFLILTVLIPIAEEWLIRGWLVRWWEGYEGWHQVRLQRTGWGAWGALVVYAVLTHPHEALAAIVWFSLVHWLMRRTGSLWDCVVAHAVTNGLLGAYIVSTEQWQLW